MGIKRILMYPSIILTALIWSFWYYAVRCENPIRYFGDWIRWKGVNERLKQTTIYS